MKKLPIGIQSFEEIRNYKDNYVYVDKTRIIFDLTNKGSKYNFISRPRRFGKSLMIDTIKCLFEGKKELFEGLYVYDKRNWDETNPVIKISFGKGFHDSRDYLRNTFTGLFNYYSGIYDISLNMINIGDKFGELIQKICEKTGRQVVVLIDEYDKPILDVITKKSVSKEIRDELKGFYGVLKDSDVYLEYVFLTGVSKFSKVSLFSGLNNLEDLTLNEQTGMLCGYTEQEITDNFQEYLEGVDREEMKRWYNGFNFLGKDRIYNPFDVLLFLKNKEFRNYWFETATPTFLMDLLNESERYYHIPHLENLSAGEELIGSFDVDRINIETLLFQTGYLTIKEVSYFASKTDYRLQIPNMEINTSLNEQILKNYLQATDIINYFTYAKGVYFSLKDGKIEEFMRLLKQLFSGIAYHNIQKIAKYEGYYVSVVYVLLFSIGMDIVQEDITNQGRIDLTVKVDKNIYVIEFKVEKTEKTAMEQIKQNKYYEKYLGEDGKKVYLVGIDFSFEDRNISGYEVEEM